jgi:diguanylate cyclase (GGDEF)-like protein
VRFWIDPQKCVSCLACVRVCPAEAVAVDGDSVSIVEEACIRCGMCVPACPHDAIDASGELGKAVGYAASGRAVLILSVEAAAYFYPSTPEQVVNAAFRAGFRAVHHGVTGDELVAAEYLKLWAEPEWGTMIRSTCPVVVETIRREYPELLPYLAPVETPVAAEARYLRRLYGRDVPIVYAGVCLADGEADVDAVVTFEELARLFEVRGVVVSEQPLYFDRVVGERRRHLSTAGGMPLPVLQEEHQASRRFRKVRGLGGLAALARAVAVDGIDLGFVDILPCEGCLDHPLLGPREELFWRRRVVGEAEPPRSRLPVLGDGVGLDVGRGFGPGSNGRRIAESDIEAVIEAIGRAPTGKPWDCGACGYGTCAAFAEALIKGRATYRQCPPYQERRLAEAAREAAVDRLTGLATFRVFRDRLVQEVARSKRSGEPFAVVFVDLDRFKRLNDTYGHEAGNRVLEGVGRELQRAIRSTDVAARYGGDEFVLILVRTDEVGGRRVGEVVRRSVESMGVAMGYGEGVVTVSVGVAGYDPGRVEVDVVEEADRALYRAKAAGGNRVE